MKWLYLLINIFSVALPLIFALLFRMRMITRWKKFFLAMAITAAVFIVWDVLFTKIGVWGFNPNYLIGINLVNLPLEEVLFFFCIPFASLFIHYSFERFLPDVKLHERYTRLITGLILGVVAILLIINFGKLYTTVNYVLLLLILGGGLYYKLNELSRFYVSFLVILIPFFVVNGLLTGSWIAEEVVWYNNAENMGIRILTIPIEDIGYAFSMLFSTLWIFDSLTQADKD